LWQSLTPDQQTTFTEYFTEEAEKWKAGDFSKNVRIYPHSNEDIDDVARFMDVLKSTLAQETADGNGLQN